MFTESDAVPSLSPLPGGHSGETFLAESAGEQTVVRIYARRGAARGPNAAEIDAAVLRLVRGLVPVPEVLEVRRADPAAGTPALLVTTRLPGTPLDELLSGADGSLLERLGVAIGEVLARLAQMPMLRTGEFADGQLHLAPLPPGMGDLAEWVDTRGAGTPLEVWPADDRTALREVCDRAQEVLDRGTRSCLVHSDFNPKNLLVDPESGAITGVLDWEFAHAGSPFTDLGNMLRFDRRPELVEAVTSTYARLVVDAPDDLLDRARAADLWALVDLAAREGENPVAERAARLLRAIARSGDLHAWPDG